MRKRFLIILTAMVMAMTLTACGIAGDGKQKTDDASAHSEQEKDGIPGDVQEKSGDAAAPEPDGDVTPISLEPGLSAAVCDYLFDSVGAQTESGEVVIPGFIAGTIEMSVGYTAFFWIANACSVTTFAITYFVYKKL